MGWLDWLFGGGNAKKDAAAPRVASPPPISRPPYFAIIDVETTGLSPKKDRVLELAVVRVDQGGNVVDEWSTRFNPEGPVGATHIHGITQADVANAPLFRDVAASVVPYIAGLPIAAHNARFDLAFLRAEFRRAGWDLPWLPAYCTLDGSHHYMPDLDRRRLVDCCWSARIPLNDAHSALGDARATAGLLRHYLQAQGRARPHPALLSVQNDARGVVWPAGPSRAPLAFLPDEPAPARSRPIRVTNAKPKQPALITQLSKLSLVEVLDEGAPVGSLTYVETLLDALEDGVVSEDEAAALQDLVEVYELSDADVADAHQALVLALAHKALDDGHVSRDERTELESIASSLRLSGELVPKLIAEADAARATRLSAKLGPLPADWALGEPLRVGDKVVFTGFDGRERERARLERRTQELGVRLLGTVSGLTAMLVSDGSFAGGKLARAQELGTRIVDPETYAILLKHLQPAKAAAPKPKRAARATTTAVAGSTPVTVQTTTSPGAIRAWGIENGYTVGVRGRLSTELVQAYELALLDAQKEPAGP
ncbi:Lsr2 family protein [Microbacterium sp. LMI12-1-1.1]|uniref:exonuclease domain-containing protein n=1 Tax=Microbacterium sp. LMI12-1-1.1 TaxID=3135225 RepID=UPI003444AA2E